jgi:hypothetical protein
LSEIIVLAQALGDRKLSATPTASRRVVVWFHGRVQDTAGLSVLTKPLNDVRLAFCFKRGRSVSERWFNVSCILTQGFHYDGQGTKVPTRFSDDIPEIEAVADGAHGVFAIDSGNSGSLVIHATFGQKPVTSGAIFSLDSGSSRFGDVKTSSPD